MDKDLRGTGVGIGIRLRSDGSYCKWNIKYAFKYFMSYVCADSSHSSKYDIKYIQF